MHFHVECAACSINSAINGYNNGSTPMNKDDRASAIIKDDSVVIPSALTHTSCCDWFLKPIADISYTDK